jgi:hypothetical protein
VTQLLYGADRTVCEWVQQKLRIIISPPYAAIGAINDAGVICGGAVFSAWNGSNIDITLAGVGCLTRQNIKAVYRYVFGQIKANRATAITRRSNKMMRDLLPRLGFEKEAEGVLRRYYGPDRADDAFIFALFPENARNWL